MLPVEVEAETEGPRARHWDDTIELSKTGHVQNTNGHLVLDDWTILVAVEGTLFILIIYAYKTKEREYPNEVESLFANFRFKQCL